MNPPLPKRNLLRSNRDHRELSMDTLALYKSLIRWPGGRWLFSKLVCQTAPYFSSIRPTVLALENNSCTILVKKRRRVKNHIGTVHAIANCNAAELAMGLVMQTFLPAHLRWIPKGMQVQYLKKADTDIRAVCDFSKIATLTPGDHAVPVRVLNSRDEEVTHAEILVYISAKKS